MRLQNFHPGWLLAAGVVAWVVGEYVSAHLGEPFGLPFIVAAGFIGFAVEEAFRDVATGDEVFDNAMGTLVVGVLIAILFLLRFIDVFLLRLVGEML
jgi:hypothetical protein